MAPTIIYSTFVWQRLHFFWYSLLNKSNLTLILIFRVIISFYTLVKARIKLGSPAFYRIRTVNPFISID